MRTINWVQHRAQTFRALDAYKKVYPDFDYHVFKINNYDFFVVLPYHLYRNEFNVYAGQREHNQFIKLLKTVTTMNARAVSYGHYKEGHMHHIIPRSHYLNRPLRVRALLDCSLNTVNLQPALHESIHKDGRNVGLFAYKYMSTACQDSEAFKENMENWFRFCFRVLHPFQEMPKDVKAIYDLRQSFYQFDTLTSNGFPTDHIYHPDREFY